MLTSDSKEKKKKNQDGNDHGAKLKAPNQQVMKWWSHTWSQHNVQG